MRIKQTIPEYIVGQRVTILNNLALRERRNNVSDAGLGSMGRNNMMDYQGREVTITGIIRGRYYRIAEDDNTFSWSPNMFKESYARFVLSPITRRYEPGNIVSIYENIRDLVDVGNQVTSAMVSKVNRLARIIHVMELSLTTVAYRIQFLDEDIMDDNIWYKQHFQGSYILENDEINDDINDKQMENEISIENLKVGMYLFHEQYNSGNSRHILAVIREITAHNRILVRYIHKSSIRDHMRHYNLDGEPDEEIILNTVTSGLGSNIVYDINIHKTKNRVYVSNSMYIPDEKDLLEIFGLSNSKFLEGNIKEGMLPIPKFFENSKYQLKKVDLHCKDGNIYRELYAFRINDYTYVNNISFGKYKTLHIDLVYRQYQISSKDYKDILTKFSGAKVIGFKDSVELFGHKTRKENMYNSLIANSKSKTIFKINNVIFNYEKEGKYYHVAEVNDGTYNLKFLLSDLEIILPNINNYILPKERKISTQTICKVTKDKLLPVKKGETVKVIKMFNRHMPVKGVQDRNTICIVVDNNNKQFECKAHQLKRI